MCSKETGWVSFTQKRQSNLGKPWNRCLSDVYQSSAEPIKIDCKFVTVDEIHCSALWKEASCPHLLMFTIGSTCMLKKCKQIKIFLEKIYFESSYRNRSYSSMLIWTFVALFHRNHVSKNNVLIKDAQQFIFEQSALKCCPWLTVN